MAIHDVGDPVRLRARFTDLAGNYADPTTVTATVRSPTGITTTYAVPPVVNDPALLGGFYLDVTPSEAGRWAWRFAGTGAVVAAEESTFLVLPSLVGGDSPVLCSPWVSAAEVSDCCSETNADILARAVLVASEILYLRSGQRWPGSCTKTVRPCPSSCDGCCCCWAPTITLHDDVTEIVSVWQDGVLVPTGEYRLDENRYLVRLANADGSNDGWRACQRLDQPRTANETLEVTYWHGRNPPWSGVMAAAAFACQIALSCTGSDDCTLPQRVQNLVSQGVTMTMVDSFDFLDRGRLGVYEVDMFLSAANPSGLQSAPTVISPDYRPPRRTG